MNFPVENGGKRRVQVAARRAVVRFDYDLLHVTLTAMLLISRSRSTPYTHEHNYTSRKSAQVRENVPHKRP